MRQTLNGMRRRGSEDRGFTMIELLVVVVIIGVLVAIAVPVYLNYRKGAANKSAQSDVRGAITAVEQYYTDNGNQYPDSVTDTAEGEDLALDAPDESGTDQTIKVSPGNILRFVNTSGTGTTSYKICGRNTDGEQTYVYDSDSGGSVSPIGGSLEDCATAE